MTEAQATVKSSESTISNTTKVVLPLPIQISIWVSIIIITSAVVGGYFQITGMLSSSKTEIEQLKENKLDKSTYDSDRRVDKILQENNGKKLDAIMRKMNIENY